MNLFVDLRKKRSLAALGMASLPSILFLAGLPGRAKAEPQAAAPGQSAPAKQIGTIKSIAGDGITLSTDAGASLSVTVQDNAKILRIEPGAKNLSAAAPLNLADLQTGDRILVVGKLSADGHTLMAASIVAMKKADVVSKQQHDQQDWQRRGVGGLVSAVDPGSGTITISTQTQAGAKNIAIHVSKETVVRRYAPDSIKFDDAKISSLADIKPGDQVRARGTRNADGSEWTAEEIVSGSFRNIAGTISSVDAASNTLSVMDLISKKPVTVKIAADSQMRKLPPQMAQAMAMRLKGGASGTGQGAASGNGANGAAARPAGGSADSGGGGGQGASESAGARGGRGGADLQQMLSRVPPASLSDLQKGEAVMIVSTEGDASSGVTAITLVAGVEPILEASPNGAQSMILPPWSLDASGGGEAAQ